MPPVEAVAPRRAALLLHALPEQARAQVMQQLSSSHRATVEALLVELQAMGIPQDRDWLSLVDHEPSSASTPWEQADRLRAADVVRALEGQSLHTMAAVLGIREWSWRQGVLAALPADQRIRLNGLLGAAVEIRDAVAQALLIKLLAQVAIAKNVQYSTGIERSRRPAQARSWLQRLF